MKMSSGHQAERICCLTVIVLLASVLSNLSVAYAAKKVIVIGFDGMDPRLCERMMNAGDLPTFDKLRKQGGYKQIVLPSTRESD